MRFCLSESFDLIHEKDFQITLYPNKDIIIIINEKYMGNKAVNEKVKKSKSQRGHSCVSQILIF